MEPKGQLLIEQRDRVLLLTLSDPDTRNALHPGIYRAGIEALQRAADDAGTGAVVLSGAHGVFSSGGNLNRLSRNREKPRSVQYGYPLKPGQLVISMG
jgi:enoyl-CoA hydratase/carnithine racemase